GRDDRTAVLARLDESFGFERAQGLADRDPGDGVPLGQGDFPQLGSRSDPALDDVVANPGADIGPSGSRVGFDRTGAVVLPAAVLRIGQRHLPAAKPWAPRGFAPALNRPVAGSRVTHDSRPSSQSPARVTTLPRAMSPLITSSLRRSSTTAPPGTQVRGQNDPPSEVVSRAGASMASCAR